MREENTGLPGVKAGGLRRAASAAGVGAERPALPDRPDKAVVINDAGHALAKFSLREIWDCRELLYFLTWRDIKVRYKQTAMGAAWAVIQPLFMMLVFALFFGILIGVPTENMPHLVFFYCGLLPWTFVANGVVNGSMSLVSSSNLITKVYFPRILVPVAAVAAGLVDLLIASVILLGLAFFYRIHIGWGILLLLPLLLLSMLLTLGLGVWLAALVVKYRDVRHVIPFVLQLWMFLTPVIYPQSVVPKKWLWMIHVNPLTGIVEGIRASLMGRPLDRQALVVSVSVTVVALVAAVFTFRRIEQTFADLI
jgi:lipopolysaccharide transport system permease protein